LQHCHPGGYETAEEIIYNQKIAACNSSHKTNNIECGAELAVKSHIGSASPLAAFTIFCFCKEIPIATDIPAVNSRKKKGGHEKIFRQTQSYTCILFHLTISCARFHHFTVIMLPKYQKITAKTIGESLMGKIIWP